MLCVSPKNLDTLLKYLRVKGSKKPLYNHCDINGNTKDNCWKLHPELNPKNSKKDVKKKYMLAIDLNN